MKKTPKKIICIILTAAIFLLSSGIRPVTASAAGEDWDRETVQYKNYDIIISDDFFRQSSSIYNSTLAVLSVMMTHFSMPLGQPTDENDTSWYAKQPERLKGFFEAIHFENFDTNEDYVSRSAFDTIGVGAASKKVDDYTVIGIVPRSGGYYREWANNVYLGDGSQSDYMHEGWYNAANKLLNYLDEYIAKYNITGKVKVWMTGFSRGGATANIAAALLDNRIGTSVYSFSNGATLIHKDLYAYTFEAPQGANVNSKTVLPPKAKMYTNIFNIVHPDDLVPKVAMKQYGFTRFGVDYYILTEFYDPDNYKKDIEVVKAFYKKYNPKNTFKADVFDMYGIPGEKAALALTGIGGIAFEVIDSYISDSTPFITKDDRKANYDANIAETIFIEKLCAKIGNRKDYCSEYQDDVSDLLLYYMNEQEKEKGADVRDLFVGVVIGGFAEAMSIGDLGLTSLIMSNMSGPAGTGERLVDSMTGVIAKIAADIPNEAISIIKYVNNVFQNHEPELIIAYMQAQDSYYISDYNVENGTSLHSLSSGDNADFIRGSYVGFNDIAVFDPDETDINPVNDKDGDGLKVLINVEGYMNGRSDVKRALPGYAAGYYSYITEERMEIFLPIDGKYRISARAYSKKPLHRISYNIYRERFALQNSPAVKLLINKFEDDVILSSNRNVIDIG